MKLLEHVLYGASDLPKIKRILAKSTLNNVNLQNDEEKTLVSNLVKAAHKSDKASSIYLTLKAASLGPDTNYNYSLRYIYELPTFITDKHPENINKILDYFESGAIQHAKNEIDTYLKNASLYNRNDQDFEYTVKAFDAVIYKKSRYFDADTNNNVLVAISQEQNKALFGNDLSDYTFRDDATGDEYAENVDHALVPIDQKYFFDGKQVSATDTIIPAGFGGSAGENERTIWNYMEIWSSGVDNSGSKTKSSSTRRQNKEKVEKAKQVINNQNMTKEVKDYLSKTLDDLWNS